MSYTTLTETPVQTTFVLATSVHVRNIPNDTDPVLTKFYEQNLGTTFKVMPTVMMTFIYLTHALAAFVLRVSKVSAVTGPI